MALVVLLPLFSNYPLLGFGFLSILIYTSIEIILSTVLYIIASKHKAAAAAAVHHVDNDKLVEEKVVPISCYDDEEEEEEESSDQDQQEKVASAPLCKFERVAELAKEGHQEEVNMDDDDDAPKSNYYSTTISLSESECQNQCFSTSEGSHQVLDWNFGYNNIVVDDHINRSDYSDGSISDEESLIEIALASGHYVDPHKLDEEPKYKKRKLSAEEALFSQQSLIELLSEEFNQVSDQEENLIEIDISMGSIKYSRFV